jgi:hypothetical protein
MEAELSGEMTEPSEDIMKILYSEKGPESPFEESPKAKKGRKGLKAYSGDYWGAFSLERFATASNLNYTHDDAYGWLEYLQKFHPRNFWYGDRNVKVWAYYETYDNWQDTYGMDAVLAVYHSGHGGMRSDGRFWAPLGANWGGLGSDAWSHLMRLGNEQVRYIFWSTCTSCRVSGGHSPIRTWSPANLGFRMLFGYETVSYDDPDYGRYFWKHWRKGKSFSSAFLDASWEISHRQAPSVVACGATRDEAINRIYYERNFYWGKVSTNWWWWRWYNAATTATASRNPNQELPSELLIAKLEPVLVDGQYVKNILAKHDIGIGLPRQVLAGPDGVFSVKEGDIRIALEGDGAYEVQFAEPNLDNEDQISMHKAQNIAQDFIDQHGLDYEGLTFDRIMLSQEGGESEKDGQSEGPFVTETIIQYTQLINDLPVLLPGKGSVSVVIDNDGTVTGIKNSTHRIKDLIESYRTVPEPPEKNKQRPSSLDPLELLDDIWQERMKEWIIKGKMPLGYQTVPGSYEIGYAIKGNEAQLVARRDIEVECDKGIFKRFALEVPILD